MAIRPGSPTPPPARLPTVFRSGDYDVATLVAHVRAGRWCRIARGGLVLATDVPDERTRALSRVAAAEQRLTTPHWFSHETAALVWGLPVWRLPERTHVRQRGSASARRDPRLTTHRDEVPRRHLVGLGGTPVTDLVLTAVDCARSLPARDALVVADGAVRTGVEPGAIADLLAALGGRPGAARARGVLAHADGGAESAYESVCRFELLRAGLPTPETQVEVGTRLGTFWADLGYRRWHLLIEFDGAVKYDGRDSLIREKRRHDALVEAGWRVLRVTAADLAEPGRVVGRVRALLPVGVPLVSRPELNR